MDNVIDFRLSALKHLQSENDKLHSLYLDWFHSGNSDEEYEISILKQLEAVENKISIHENKLDSSLKTGEFSSNNLKVENSMSGTTISFVGSEKDKQKAASILEALRKIGQDANRKFAASREAVPLPPVPQQEKFNGLIKQLNFLKAKETLALSTT